MQKKLCFALSVTLVCFWADASPTNLGSLEFDNLDTDISDLKYEVEEEDLDDFSKLLDEADATPNAKKTATTVNTSGFKKKNATNKGTKNKFSIEDLKKFFKIGDLHDDGAYDDADVYALAEGGAAQAVGITGKEDRKYRKGTKTRGYHHVVHKDDYKKDKEIYEDDETSGVIRKVGAKGIGFGIGAGAGFSKGHFHHDRHKGLSGKQGLQNKRNEDKQFNEYADEQGFDAYFKSANK